LKGCSLQGTPQFIDELAIMYLFFKRYKMKIMARIYGCITIFIISLYFPFRISATEYNHRLGVANTGGLYPNYGNQYLFRSSQDVLDMGFKNIEINISPGLCWTSNVRPNGLYHNMSLCPVGDKTLTQVAQSAFFRPVLDLPFKTMFLEAEAMHPEAANQWRISIIPLTQDRLNMLRTEFYDFTVWLLDTYRDTNRTFVLMTPGELDWQMLANKGCPNCDYQNIEPDQFAIENAILYLNTIQDAIDQAKRDHAAVGMNIYHGCEINLVEKGMNGKKSAVNDVFPRTRCDLIGISAYETAYKTDSTSFTQMLEYVVLKAPDSAIFGSKNVFISETGFPENTLEIKGETNAVARATNVMMQSFQWGVPYFNYWQIYDNECTKTNPTDSDCPGFWLKKPSGATSRILTDVYSRYLNFPGDLDSDQHVDIFDYNDFIGDFGKTGAYGWIPADIIKDGTVDIFDYNELVTNFGK